MNEEIFLAEKFAEKVTWATGIDMKTGRPIEREGARYEDGEELIWPSVFGAHNFHAMSFNPKTGLVYIPKTELPSLFKDGKVNVLDWTRPDWKFDLAVDMSLHGDIPKEAGVASLLAWDPVNQKKVWEVPQPSYWNPGTVTTAGNLVFQGRIDGKFAAYDALTGAEMKAEYPDLYQRLNVARNEAWLPRVRALLDDQAEDDALVVVGALHLVGEDGLVRRLREAGYTVERL